MPTSRTEKTQHSSTHDRIQVEDITYYNRRLQNRVFNEVIKAFAQEIKAGRTSKAELARRIGKKPEQITRWLAGPSNLTLDTISTILFGLDAELDANVAFFRDRHEQNYTPSLIEYLDTISAHHEHTGIFDKKTPSTSTDSPNIGKVSVYAD